MEPDVLVGQIARETRLGISYPAEMRIVRVGHGFDSAKSAHVRGNASSTSVSTTFA